MSLMSSKGFPSSIERAALRTRGGKYAWPREYIPRAVGALLARGYAAVRLEPWVRQEADTLTRAKMRDGTEAPALECKRAVREGWDLFCERCASEALSALQRFPEQDVALSGEAKIVYHLAWAIPRERRKAPRELAGPDSLDESAT